jgi:PST family polysaccharide transporter
MTNIDSPFWLKLLPKSIRQRLVGRKTLFALLHNSGWLLADKAMRMLFGLVVGVMVTRYLGPSQFGELAYAFAYIAFFQALANLGLDGLIIRDLTHRPVCAGQILGTAFILRLFSGVFCWIAAIFIMALMDGWGKQEVWIVALAGSSLIFQVADTVDLWFQSQSQNWRTVLAKLLAYFVSSMLRIFLVIYEAPLLAFAGVVALDGLFASLALAYAYKKFPCNEPWYFIKNQAIALIKESWPYMLSGLSIMVYMRIDQILVLKILGQRESGIYAAVLAFATVWQFIPMTLMSSLAPFVAKAKQESNNDYSLALVRIFKAFAILGWLVCLPIAFFSESIVLLLYGSAYIEGGSVLRIYVFTNLFINLGVAQGFWLLNEGKSTISLYKSIVGGVVCILADLLLIPMYGLIGAAIAAVIAQMVSTTLVNIVIAPGIFKMQMNSILLRGLIRRS